jgi:hypothetical protein
MLDTKYIVYDPGSGTVDPVCGRLRWWKRGEREL